MANLTHKKFDEIFKFPLKSYDFDDYSNVYSSDDLLVFQFYDPIPDRHKLNIIDLLNGTNKSDIQTDIEYPYVYDKKETNILITGFPTISIRGFGHLTGTLKLKYISALRIQDELAEFILEKIKNYNIFDKL